MTLLMLSIQLQDTKMLNIDDFDFEQMVHRIDSAEFELNKASSSYNTILRLELIDK